MSNFTPLVKKEFEFEGDKVWVTFSRLRRKDMLELIPLLGSLKTVDGGEETEEKRRVTAQAIEMMYGLLPTYIQKMDGLKDTEGNDISVETLSTEVYFMALATDIVLAVLNESIVLDGSKGKNG